MYTSHILLAKVSSLMFLLLHKKNDLLQQHGISNIIIHSQSIKINQTKHVYLSSYRIYKLLNLQYKQSAKLNALTT